MSGTPAPEEEVSDLLTLAQVCERLGTSNQRVYVLVKEGKLHPGRLPGGRRIFYLSWEVEALAHSLSCTFVDASAA